MRIELEDHELRLAVSVGCERQIQNIYRARTNQYGNDDSRCWQDHIEGAIGEYVVAKCLGRFWNGALGKMRAKDVGELQVRATRHVNGKLLVHDEDDRNDAFVLVRGAGKVFDIAGWLYGADAQCKDFWDTTIRYPCYAVESKYLTPIEGLPSQFW